MEHLVVILITLAYVASSPLNWSEDFPRNLPEEENLLRKRFIILEDGNGKYQVVDLLKEETNSPKATVDDVTFYLFTQSNSEDPIVIPASDINTLANSAFFSSERENVFICHGWTNSHESPVNVVIRTAILQRHDVNVFVTDWSGPASQGYTTARNDVPIVGQIIGNFINQMMNKWDVTPATFNIVGHSLGAHVAGCAGAAVDGDVNWIVGLDPAGPGFTVSNTDNRIDSSDGDFVQIIHTNSGIQGFAGSIGDADFYPNGGTNQSGCGNDASGSCAHGRAYEYYAESIVSSGFAARSCSSITDFNNGLCSNGQRSLMGEWNIDKTARGDFYLNTNSESPFAQGD